jgi:type IV pilus assembly protein PilB
MPGVKKKRLGEVLLERGHVSTDDLDRTLQEQQGRFVPLGELILQRGLVRKDALAEVLSEVAGVPYFDCTALTVDPAILKLIPDGLARRYRAIPVELEGKTLTVVMAEPQNLKSIAELGFKTGLKITPRLGFQHEIADAIDRLYGTKPASTELVDVSDDDSGMEFISSSAHQRNVEAFPSARPRNCGGFCGCPKECCWSRGQRARAKARRCIRR